MFKGSVKWMGITLVLACSIGLVARAVYAEGSQSTNFRLDESTVGAGGLVQSSSGNFQSNTSISDLAIGNAASSNYQIEDGSKTTHDPTLTFRILNASPTFGNFSATSSAVATTTFSVSNYTSYGYVVQILGNAPTNGPQTIPALASSTSPQTGVEQFGINLVANTSPSVFGANPNNGQFGFGEVAPNYGVANKFRFVSGETIALAPKTSGETIYTMSYMVNVSPLTPGGQYRTNQTLVVTGTY